MKQLSEAQQGLLKALAGAFFEVVPLRFRTYCTLSADISRRVLSHHGIPATIVPCQLWHTRHGSNIVVGFTEKVAQPGKWNGHVLCAAGDWFIDAALHQLKVQFGLSVPSVAIGRLFAVPSQALARIDLSPTEQLWWHKPPVADPPFPVVAPELAERYSEQLIERLAPVAAR